MNINNRGFFSSHSLAMNSSTSSDPTVMSGCIRERTRNLLGWSEPFSNRMHPYRVRRFSSGSSCSSDSSQPSPSSSTSCSTICESPHPAGNRATCEITVFNRIRNIVPTLRQDANVFQILVDSVSNLMDEIDERDLVEMKPTASHPCYALYQSPLNNEICMPEDLLSVDVTAFKHLIYSQPVYFSPNVFCNTQ